MRPGQSEDLAALDANYLRRSDAELFRGLSPRPNDDADPASVEADLPLVRNWMRDAPEAPAWREDDLLGLLNVASGNDERLAEHGWRRMNRVGGLRRCDGAFPPWGAKCAAECELELVLVPVHARRRGIGGKLVQTVLAWARIGSKGDVARDAGIEYARDRALPAMRLHRAGRRPGYYVDPSEDALLMRCGIECSSGERPYNVALRNRMVRDGYWYAISLLLVAAVVRFFTADWYASWPLVAIPLLLAAFFLWFFRDPKRTIPDGARPGGFAGRRQSHRSRARSRPPDGDRAPQHLPQRLRRPRQPRPHRRDRSRRPLHDGRIPQRA